MGTATLQSEWYPAASRHAASTAELWLGTAAFLVIHLLLRCLLTCELHRDDAELVYFDQTLAWGYSEQGPLLSWIFRIWALLCGISHFSLGMLRITMLAGVFIGIYANARTLELDERTSLLAACSALFLPLTAWHAIHHWTHSLLLVNVMLAAMCAFLRWLRKPTWRTTFALGVFGGLGMLAKYNFAVFTVALLAAGVSVRSLRPTHWNRLMLAALVASVIFLPHGLWLLQHWQEIWPGYVDKFSPDQASALAPMPAGVAGLGRNAVVLLGIPSLLAAWVARGSSILKRKPTGWEAALLACYLAWVIALLAVITVLGGIHRFQQRWLEPFVVPIVLLVFLRFGKRGLDGSQKRRLAIALVLLGIGLTACRAGQVWLSRTTLESGIGYRSFAKLLGEVNGDAAVVTHDGSIAGNLRFRLPQFPVVNVDRRAVPISEAQGKCTYVLVWDASVHGPRAPGVLTNAAARMAGAALRASSPVQRISLTNRLAGESPLQVAWQAFTRTTP